MNAVEDGMKIGTCEYCEDEGVEVFEDNNRCHDCDGQFYRCSICKEEQHEDDHCRHIFMNDNYEWSGSGANIFPQLKEPLFKLFDLMPAGFAIDLRAAIRSGKFHTWLMSSLLGGGMLELHGMPEREDMNRLFGWGDAIIEIGEGEHAEETHDGYYWLVSLYDNKTLKANRVTV